MNFHWLPHNDNQPPDQKQLEQLAALLRIQMSGEEPLPGLPPRGTSAEVPAGSPTLSVEKKARIRAHMFERIDRFSPVQMQQELPLEVPSELPATVDGADETESFLIDRLISWIRSSSRSIKMSLVKKEIIRDRLHELPGPVFFQPFAIQSFLAFFSSRLFRRVTASLSLSAVFLFAVFAFSLKVPVTFAREMTVMHEVVGSVSVTRDGQQIAAQKGFELEEGDTIVTGQDGKAIVTYFDRSITRFFENTQVSFNSLRSENFGFDHSVSLSLDTGRMWSNIIDYVTNSEFKVTARDLVASVSKRATFLLSAERDTASLQVFHNMVNVGSVGNNEVVGVPGKAIVKGYQVVSTLDLPRQVVQPISLKEEEKRWVAANIVSDQVLLGEVEKGNKGVVAGPLGRLQENASLLLAFNPDERLRLELNIAEKNFYEVFRRAGVTVDEVRAAFDVLTAVVERSVAATSEDVKKLAEAVLLSARGELLAAKPDSQLYDLKIALEDKDFAGVSGDAKLLMALDQASQFLTEAQDLQINGATEVARKAAGKYQERVKEIDSIFAQMILTRVLVAPQLLEKRELLEKLYVAFKTPAPVVLPMVGDQPVIVATPPVSEISPDTIDRGGLAGSSDVAAVVPMEKVRPSAEEALQLPPKLQLSRD